MGWVCCLMGQEALTEVAAASVVGLVVEVVAVVVEVDVDVAALHC